MKKNPTYLVRDTIKLEIISELQDLYSEKVNLEKNYPEDRRIGELVSKIAFWEKAMYDEDLLNDVNFSNLESYVENKNGKILNEEIDVLKKIIKINVVSLLR